MNAYYYRFFLLHFIQLVNIADCNYSKNQDKLIKKIKNLKPAFKECNANFEKEFDPSIETRRFYVSPNKDMLLSRTSMSQLYKMISNETCSKTDECSSFIMNSLSLTWRYQFLESAHCIRVELDFINTTRFLELTNYKYYRFSYRELGKRNSYLKRNKIEPDEINQLTIHRVKVRPYIVCVSFYKQDNILQDHMSVSFDEYAKETNNNRNLTYFEIRDFLFKDDRAHDTEMCIDIDIHGHFLGFYDTDPHEISGELLMVIFIICLVATLLASITLAHYIIMKPKQKRLLRALIEYVQRKKNNSGGKDNLNSIASSKNSLTKEKSTHNPAITVSDFTMSSFNNNSNSSLKYDEAKETEPLMHSNSNLNNNIFSSSNTSYTPSHSKVRFHIEETIIEESPNSSQSKLDSENKEQNEVTEECIKSISHLLDDKPWLPSSASAAALSQMKSFNNN